MRILLTGFEPFGGSRVNPSQQVVEGLVRGGAFTGRNKVEIVPIMLPVDGVKAPRRLLAVLERVRPEAAVCLGESARAAAITFERLFVNIRDYRIADNANRIVRDRPIVRGAPAAYFSTLPIESMRRAVESAGVAAETSFSAGTFLCNQVAYVMLHRLHEMGRTIPAGFIHLPRLPSQAKEAGAPSGVITMDLSTMTRGVIVALEALLCHKSPRRRGRALSPRRRSPRKA